MVRLSKRDEEQLEKAKDLMDDGPLTDAGFLRSAFFGRLRMDKVLAYPRQKLDEADRTDKLLAKIDSVLAKYCDPQRIDARQNIPKQLINQLGRIGLLGMTVPKQYGGGGFSYTAYCRALERVARTCSSTAVLIGAHQSIGLKALVLNGNEQQKQRFLPDLAAGRKLAAFALTEPEAGSDAANVQSRAVMSGDGKYWVLNGEKKFITNGALAGMMTVMARTKIGDNGHAADKVTAFLVTPDMEGLEVVSPNRDKCGIRGTWQATLRFNDMKVPAENVLGELGRGLRVALTVLDYGRCTLSAGCVGGAKVALEMAVGHAQQRRQFGRRLGEFHLIKQKIARMAELVYAMDALTYLTAGMVDRHEDDLMLETAVCKIFCSEAGWRVIDDAVQIHGGEGYMSKIGLERMLRDARINRIVEGATEVMTSFVALMGMKGVGEEFEEVLNAARQPVKNMGRLAQFARHEWRDILIGANCPVLHPKLRAEADMLTQLTRSLARGVSQLLAKHRQKILDKQLLQQRVAWAAIELYAMAAVIGKLQTSLDEGPGHENSPALARDLIVGKGYCHHAAGRIGKRLKGLQRNGDRHRLAVADAVLGFDKQDA